MVTPAQSSVPNGPNLPDLAPGDFFLLPKMKFKLRGCFDTVEERHAHRTGLPVGFPGTTGFPGTAVPLCSRALLHKGTTAKVMV